MMVWMSLQKREMSVQSNYDNVSPIIKAGLIIDRNDNICSTCIELYTGMVMLYFVCCTSIAATVWIQYAQQLNLRYNIQFDTNPYIACIRVKIRTLKR